MRSAVAHQIGTRPVTEKAGKRPRSNHVHRAIEEAYDDWFSHGNNHDYELAHRIQSS